VNTADERKATDTDAQFFYKTRKKSIGPFKKQFWSLSDGAREAIGASLEEQFHFLFDQLKIAGTRDLVARHVHPVEIHKSPSAGTPAGRKESVEGLSD